MNFKTILKLGAVCTAATLTLTACGEDSSSANIYSKSESISIDEATHTLYIHTNEGNEGCFKEGDNFIWKTGIVVDPYTFTYKYSFVGDTLVLQQCEMEGEEQYCYRGTVLVGGRAGSITGDWHTLNCHYKDNDITCETYNDNFYSVNYNISTTAINYTADISQFLERSNNVPLAESEFLAHLVKCFGSASNCYVHGDDVFYSEKEEVASSLAEYQVQIVNQSNNSLQFSTSLGVVSVNVKEHHRGADDLYAEGNVSLGDSVCNFSMSISYDTKPYCSTENAEYLKTDTYSDEAGVKQEYSYKYEYSNTSEFRTCLAKMFHPNSDSYIFYKDAADNNDKSLRDDIREINESLLRHVMKQVK